MNECNGGRPRKLGDVPQFRRKTVDEVAMVPREQVQQLTAKQIGDVPQRLEETVEAVKTALEERNCESGEAIKVPKISRDTVISCLESVGLAWTCCGA